MSEGIPLFGLCNWCSVKSAWAKFRELAPILTARGASLKVKGKVYRTCVQTVMLYGGETWPVKVEDLHRL